MDHSSNETDVRISRFFPIPAKMSYKELEGLSWERSVAEEGGRFGTLWRPDLGALS